MSPYDENNFETENQSYSYGQAPQMQPELQQPVKEKKKGHKKVSRIFKKAGAITLSALLFGGVASGTFLGMNYMAGYTMPDTTVQTAAPDTTTNLLKSDGSNVTNLPTAAQGSLDVTGIAKAVMPSIVSITNKSVQEVQNYFSMFGFSGQPQFFETESSGSGIIIGKNDTELLIVTNYHVIENANTLSALFIDNKAYEAKVKGTDPKNDLAVIAIPLQSISADTMSQIAIAAVGDSDALSVGEQVVAIGNALGYGQSVTTGIVSATNRAIGTQQVTAEGQENAEDVQTYIQTDAAINPGNSGGALVNMNGEVVGINSAKLASTEIEGMGYAIPVSRVSNIIETLMNETTRNKVTDAERAAIGITGLTVDESVTQVYGIPSGAFVADVTEGGAAQKAGLKKGDVIVKFDGKTIEGIEQLKDRLQYYAAGETVTVTIKTVGENGYTEKDIPVTLERATESEKSNEPVNQATPFPFQ